MKEITQKQLYKILYIATSRTYLKALIENTPGKGIVGSEWDLEVSSRGIILFNEQYGDIIKYLEKGTIAHDIKPKTSKALAFPWGGAPAGMTPNGKGGEFVFKKVRHPGTEARRFVQKVIEDKSLEKEWNLIFEKELEKLVS